ncbi:hypothetical protein Csa_000587 [Cucumis sativus]|nr:hypothetical protein Csa_000587 [Cucumis sativus]
MFSVSSFGDFPSLLLRPSTPTVIFILLPVGHLNHFSQLTAYYFAPSPSPSPSQSTYLTVDLPRGLSLIPLHRSLSRPFSPPLP